MPELLWVLAQGAILITIGMGARVVLKIMVEALASG